MELPPLRKKTPQERAEARLEEGEDLTIALHGDRAVLDEEAWLAMRPQAEQSAPPPPPPDMLKSLTAAIQEQTEALKSVDTSDTEELEHLFLQVKAMTYGTPIEADSSKSAEDSNPDGEEEEALYP